MATVQNKLPRQQSSLHRIITRPPSRVIETAATEPSLGAHNYQIGPEIARSGMGGILQAEDLKLKRTVALKVMHFDACTDETETRDDG